MAVGADVVTDNWDDLFDSGDDSVEQHYEEPIIADNWAASSTTTSSTAQR